jgi:integrase
MRVEDLRARSAGWELRLREKRAKHHVIPCHRELAEELHAYIKAAGIGEDRKGWLFRTAKGWKAVTAIFAQTLKKVKIASRRDELGL